MAGLQHQERRTFEHLVVQLLFVQRLHNQAHTSTSLYSLRTASMIIPRRTSPRLLSNKRLILDLMLASTSPERRMAIALVKQVAKKSYLSHLKVSHLFILKSRSNITGRRNPKPVITRVYQPTNMTSRSSTVNFSSGTQPFLSRRFGMDEGARRSYRQVVLVSRLVSTMRQLLPPWKTVPTFALAIASPSH